MKMRMFSIYDSKAQHYSMPFYERNEGSAIRTCEAAVNQQNGTNYELYPEDFHLFEVGEFDEDSGKVTPCAPRSILGFHELKQAPTEPTKSGQMSIADVAAGATE